MPGVPIALYKSMELRYTEAGTNVHVWAIENKPGMSRYITSMPKDMVFVCLEQTP